MPKSKQYFETRERSGARRERSDATIRAREGLVKFSREIGDRIIQGVKDGAAFHRVAEVEGVHRVTVWRWRERGRADDASRKRTGFARFYRELEKANSRVIVELEKSLLEQSREDWRCAAWVLMRRAPAEYAEKVQSPLVMRALGQQASEELLRFLQGHVSPGAFDEVLHALSNFGDSELDPKLLPAPA